MVSKYSAADKDMFIQVSGKYKIIEDKRTDAYTVHKKNIAWEKIVTEYNTAASEQRTVIQLKRLWDKIKRSRKAALAEERRELMATGGDPSKAPPSPQPKIDESVPHLQLEVDGINLQQGDRVIFVVPEETEEETVPGIDPLSVPVTPVVEDAISRPGPSDASDLNPLAETPRTKKRVIRKQNKKRSNQLTTLAKARLELLKKEDARMEELHKVRMEEAVYKKEAARLIMLQEEAKLKKI